MARKGKSACLSLTIPLKDVMVSFCDGRKLGGQTIRTKDGIWQAIRKIGGNDLFGAGRGGHIVGNQGRWLTAVFARLDGRW